MSGRLPESGLSVKCWFDENEIPLEAYNSTDLILDLLLDYFLVQLYNFKK